MDTAASFTFNDICNFAILLMAMWGFYKVLQEIIKAITNRHDKEQKWDEMSDKVKEEKEEIVTKYDKRLNDLDGKLQEVRTEQFIIIETLRAVLDGLHQQGCNGKVTEAMNNLDAYLNEAAHK